MRRCPANTPHCRRRCRVRPSPSFSAPDVRAPPPSPRVPAGCFSIATSTACADVLNAGRAAAVAGGVVSGRKASKPLTFLRLQQLMSLRTVHILGDGFCFARFLLFLLAEDARNTCFLSRASAEEGLLGGGKAAAAQWVPCKRMHMCARVTPSSHPPTHTHTHRPTHPPTYPRCGIIVASVWQARADPQEAHLGGRPGEK